jgi:hypothetical protein
VVLRQFRTIGYSGELWRSVAKREGFEPPIPICLPAIRPICTPQQPASHTCALDLFLKPYDLLPGPYHGPGRKYERQGRKDADHGIRIAR